MRGAPGQNRRQPIRLQESDDMAGKQRQLEFKTFADVLAELDRLRQGNSTPLGQWDLAQACNHLAFFIEGSLDGHAFKTPWIFKVLFGRLVLRRILKTRRMKSGVPTPQEPLPQPGADEAAAVERLGRAIARLEAHQGELHDSPFFGHLTPQQWRDLHLIHCAHHLGMLMPKSGG